MSNNSLPNLNNFSLSNGSNHDIFNAINKCYKKDVVNKVTRGGVNKRIFKPNIPIKVDRTKDEEKKEEDKNKDDNKQNNDNNKNRKDKFNKSDFDKRKAKNFIQLEGTFESFKSDSKTRYVNGFAGSSSSAYQSSATTIKNEQHDKHIKTEDELKREKKLEFRRATKDEDYLSELEENDLDLDDNDMPLSWTNYNKMLNKLNNLNKEEENNVKESLENGRLILMPCIFGNKTGDTGYKLQVLKSGKMRLVDKKSGFIVDLLNTGNLENDAIKEVVELNDDKLLRYGSLKNMDIYSPVRNLNSDYNSILHE